jgi:hypothetical protein
MARIDIIRGRHDHGQPGMFAGNAFAQFRSIIARQFAVNDHRGWVKHGDHLTSFRAGRRQVNVPATAAEEAAAMHGVY